MRFSSPPLGSRLPLELGLLRLAMFIRSVGQILWGAAEGHIVRQAYGFRASRARAGIRSWRVDPKLRGGGGFTTSRGRCVPEVSRREARL